jgi:hypothetical protein
MKNLILLTFLYLSFTFCVSAQYNFTLPEQFRTPRNLPLLDLDNKMDVKLTDYGAKPNDGKDDGEAISKALVMCKKLSTSGMNVRLVFEKGRYDLFSNKNNTHIIEVNNANNIVIEGNGAEIIVHDPLMGFMSVFKSNNIIVKNLFIDYDPLPFTQGKVVAVNLDSNSFDLKIDEGFPDFKHSMFKDATRVWGMLMDPTIPGKLKDGAPNLFGSKDFQEISAGVFRVKFETNRLLKFVEIGDLYVHIARTNGKTIFKSGSSKNITYLNITSYSSPAGSYAAFDMEEWNIIGCEVKLKPGRIHSANADCIHANGGKFGPWIENSLFEGYSDDAINMKAIRANIIKQNSPTELIVQGAVKKGDVIRIFNPRDGLLIGKYEVKENKFLGNREMQIILDQPITQKLNLGDTKKNDIIYVDTQSNESFVIRNNTFKNARRYGILLQNSYGVIERNLFENLSQAGITIYNGVDWGEGFVAHDILINQNIFNNCGYDFNYLREDNAAAIRMVVNKLKDLEAKGKWNGVEKSTWQGIENITITNNTFSYNRCALSIECSTNTVIKSNRFIRNSKDLSEKHQIIREDNNADLVFEN